jgi:hypothetical protein
MTKDLICPGCKTIFKIQPHMTGKSYRCKVCSSKIDIPKSFLNKEAGKSATEKAYYSDGEVSITRARFIVGSQTYVIGSITSVGFYQKNPDRTFPGSFAVCGFLFLLGGVLFQNFFTPIIGMFQLLIAAFVWSNDKTEYTVLLTTAGGEIKALTSQDAGYISTIVDALNEAIVDRG